MINILVLAAGKGERFKDQGINVPKPLIFVRGKTLISHAIDSIGILDAKYRVLTRTFEDDDLNKRLSYEIKKAGAIEINYGDHPHNGPSYTANLARLELKESLDSPLIIINCDQILSWDARDFLSFIEKEDPDGAVIIHKSIDPRNSFAKIVNGKIIEVIEKDVISDNALVGFHYWKKARYFFDSHDYIYSKRQEGHGEVYVSETYNVLIKNKYKILPFYFEDGQYIPLGIPEDLDEYSGSNAWREANL
jgi:NDP-sugar pyrophosphorylase family protein